MVIRKHVNVRAFWGGRVEPVDAQAAMVWGCWQRLAAHGRFFVVPWCRVGGDPVREIVLPAKDVLQDEMSQLCDAKGPYYSFWQSTETVPASAHVTVNLNATLALPKIYPGGISNDAILTVEASEDDPDDLALAWLLGMRTDLVRDFVDVWKPDVVEINSTPLLDRFPMRPGWPFVGYVIWLAPWVVEARKLPRAPIREEYRGGTLIGIAPDSKDPLDDATKLARKIYRSGALKPLPIVQPQPDGA